MRHNFEKLDCWRKARVLVKNIYLLSGGFPSEEKFGLTSQIRRAAVSIASNTGEGSGRGTDKAFSNFLDIAVGSSAEVETQLFLALDLGFISQNQFEQSREEVIEVRKLILGFKKYIRSTDVE